MREHRLYQADWLLRYYGFAAEEIFADADPMLDLELDPKRAWALRNPHLFPLDVNKAPRELLLRVPGLGVRVVDRIVAARRLGALRLDDVAQVCRRMTEVRPFLTTPDWRPHGRETAETLARRGRRSNWSCSRERRRDAGLAGRFRRLAQRGARPAAARGRPGGCGLARRRRRRRACADARCGGARTAALIHRIPRRFFELGDLAIRHRDPQRFARLYRLLTRLAREPRLLERATDAEVAALHAMVKSVSRDRHKMTAFVRFREREGEGPRYVAWFEPEHLIEEHVAPFFVDRYASMEFAILTPRCGIVWSGGRLSFGPGGHRQDAVDADGFSAAWSAYYRSIFNPGRLLPGAMRKEMPKKYWATCRNARDRPAARRRRAPRRRLARPRPPIRRSVERRSGPPSSPPRRRPNRFPIFAPRRSLHALRAARTRDAGGLRARAGGRADHVCRRAAGRQGGPRRSAFRRPAGALFDQALAAAGLERSQAYITNAVKHFKFVPRGKIRLHKTPDAPEIVACRWWLEQELTAVRAPLVVALGATAVFALTGKRMKLGETRGQAMEFGEGRQLFVTVHPAYVLRIPDPEQARAERQRFSPI